MGCLADRTTKAGIVGKVCTLIFVGLWFLELCALILAHQGISMVIDPITDLPYELIDSFNNELGIGELESGMQIVQTESEKVLAKCGLDPVNCAAITSGGTDPTQDPPNADKANADVEKAAIVKAFADGLSKAQKVVTDEYFGKPEMAEAATGLNTISTELEEADDGDQPCLAQNMIYCVMREAAIQTLGGVAAVNTQIDGFADHPLLVQFEDQVAPRLPLLHIIPYVFVLSLLFFTGYWVQPQTKCCQPKIGVCLYIFHIILTLVGTIISLLVVVAYLAAGPGADRVGIPDGFLAKDGADLQILKDHIKLEFPELWGAVFQPFAEAGSPIGRAFMVFLAVGIITFFYGGLVCCIKPYKKAAEAEGEAAK
jgi:hypothetical protein